MIKIPQVISDGWLLGRVLRRGCLTVLNGPSGVGKTSLALAFAMSLATGRDITWEHVHERAKVLILIFQDDVDEYARRLRALQICHELETPKDKWLQVIDLSQAGPIKNIIEKLTDRVKELASDVVIFDSLLDTDDERFLSLLANNTDSAILGVYRHAN